MSATLELARLLVDIRGASSGWHPLRKQYRSINPVTPFTVDLLGPCCDAPRLLNLVTNGRKESKCSNCGTVRPRE